MSIFRRQGKPTPSGSAAPESQGGPAGPADESAASVLTCLRDFIVELSQGQLTPEAVDPRAHLLDFGYLDSFKSAELLAFIQQRFGVELPEVELVGRLSTLEALAAHLQRQIPGD